MTTNTFTSNRTKRMALRFSPTFGQTSRRQQNELLQRKFLETMVKRLILICFLKVLAICIFFCFYYFFCLSSTMQMPQQNLNFQCNFAKRLFHSRWRCVPHCGTFLPSDEVQVNANRFRRHSYAENGARCQKAQHSSQAQLAANRHWQVDRRLAYNHVDCIASQILSKPIVSKSIGRNRFGKINRTFISISVVN